MKASFKVALPIILSLNVIVGSSILQSTSYADQDPCEGLCDFEIGGCNWAAEVIYNQSCDPGYFDYIDCTFYQIEEDYCAAVCTYSIFHCTVEYVYIANLIVEE